MILCDCGVVCHGSVCIKLKLPGSGTSFYFRAKMQLFTACEAVGIYSTLSLRIVRYANMRRCWESPNPMQYEIFNCTLSSLRCTA